MIGRNYECPICRKNTFGCMPDQPCPTCLGRKAVDLKTDVLCVTTTPLPTPPTGIAKASDAGRSSVQRAEGRLNEGAEPLSEEELAFARRNPHMLGMQDELFFRRLLATIDALRAKNERLKGSRDEWAQRSKASSKARNDADDLSRRAVSRAEAAEKRCVELEGRKAEIAALSANRVRTAEAERDAARAERDEAWASRARAVNELADWQAHTAKVVKDRDTALKAASAFELRAHVAEDASKHLAAKNAALREALEDLLRNISLDWYVQQFGRDETPTGAQSGAVARIHNAGLVERLRVSLYRARTVLSRLAAPSPDADGGGGG
jgi:hypothetical protein